VPGTVDAWAELHNKIWQTEIRDDLAPAIHYARRFSSHRVDRVLLGAFGPSLYKGLPGAFLETYTLDGKGRRRRKATFSKTQPWRKRCD